MATTRLLLESGDLLLQEDGTSALLTESSSEGTGEQFSHWVGAPQSAPFDLLLEDGSGRVLLESGGALAGETPAGGQPSAILRLPPRTGSNILLESGDSLLSETGAKLPLELAPEGGGEQFTHWVGAPTSAPFDLLLEDGSGRVLLESGDGLAGETPAGGQPLTAVFALAYTDTATGVTAALTVGAASSVVTDPAVGLTYTETPVAAVALVSSPAVGLTYGETVGAANSADTDGSQGVTLALTLGDAATVVTTPATGPTLAVAVGDAAEVLALLAPANPPGGGGGGSGGHTGTPLYRTRQVRPNRWADRAGGVRLGLTVGPATGVVTRPRLHPFGLTTDDLAHLTTLLLEL